MKNYGVQNGIFLGGVFVAVQLILFIINPKLIFNIQIDLVISLVVPVFFMYVASKNTRDDMGGMISFGEALKPAFLTYIIGSLIGIFFTYILFNFIDPQLLEMQAEMAQETAQKMIDMMGQGDNAEVQAEMANALQESANKYGLRTALFNWLVGLIFPGIILALIIAAIVKKEPRV